MRLQMLVLTLLLCATGTTFAQKPADSAAFIIRLGKDTTVIERYVRTPDQLIVEAVQRSPATSVHRLVVDVNRAGAVSRAIYAMSQPNASQPTLQRTITFSADSASIVTVQRGTSRTQSAAARDAIPIAGPFFAPYELAIMRAVSRAKGDSVALLSGTEIVRIPVARIGRDSVTLTNQFGEPMRAHVDAAGRILHLHTPAFTTVERTRWVNLDELVREFAARDASGKGLGPLSPRHTYRERVGQANIWVDYSRPAARGRPVWGGLVPYGAVWRTGANEAAHLATDRTIQLGDLTLEPGTYTLFLLPTETDLTLIVNRGTGMSGLERDSAQDIGRVKLDKQTLDQPVESFIIEVQPTTTGGVLAFAWDRTRGSIPIVVK
jgi:hypothetical protein